MGDTILEFASALFNLDMQPLALPVAPPKLPPSEEEPLPNNPPRAAQTAVRGGRGGRGRARGRGSGPTTMLAAPHVPIVPFRLRLPLRNYAGALPLSDPEKDCLFQYFLLDERLTEEIERELGNTLFHMEQLKVFQGEDEASGTLQNLKSFRWSLTYKLPPSYPGEVKCTLRCPSGVFQSTVEVKVGNVSVSPIPPFLTELAPASNPTQQDEANFTFTTPVGVESTTQGHLNTAETIPVTITFLPSVYTDLFKPAPSLLKYLRDHRLVEATQSTISKMELLGHVLAACEKLPSAMRPTADAQKPKRRGGGVMQPREELAQELYEKDIEALGLFRILDSNLVDALQLSHDVAQIAPVPAEQPKPRGGRGSAGTRGRGTGPAQQYPPAPAQLRVEQLPHSIPITAAALMAAIDSQLTEMAAESLTFNLHLHMDETASDTQLGTPLPPDTSGKDPLTGCIRTEVAHWSPGANGNNSDAPGGCMSPEHDVQELHRELANDDMILSTLLHEATVLLARRQARQRLGNTCILSVSSEKQTKAKKVHQKKKKSNGEAKAERPQGPNLPQANLAQEQSSSTTHLSHHILRKKHQKHQHGRRSRIRCNKTLPFFTTVLQQLSTGIAVDGEQDGDRNAGGVDVASAHTSSFRRQAADGVRYFL